jgi:hypothetical protein
MTTLIEQQHSMLLREFENLPNTFLQSGELITT